jgi:hypothetical protein
MSRHIPPHELALHDNAPGFGGKKTQGFVAAITTLGDQAAGTLPACLPQHLASSGCFLAALMS